MYHHYIYDITIKISNNLKKMLLCIILIKLFRLFLVIYISYFFDMGCGSGKPVEVENPNKSS